jgi:hypothetical protein
VYLKKSFDYFKTLKTLTGNLNNAFRLSVENKDFDKLYLAFSANKTELIDNLKNDFITPIERGDIFILSDIFSREMNQINILNDYSAFSWTEADLIKNTLQNLLSIQSNVFEKISVEKLNANIINKCNDGYLQSQRLSKEIYKLIKNTVVGYCENPLLKYTIYVALLDFGKQISCAFSETERIILNNS